MAGDIGGRIQGGYQGPVVLPRFRTSPRTQGAPSLPPAAATPETGATTSLPALAPPAASPARTAPVSAPGATLPAIVTPDPDIREYQGPDGSHFVVVDGRRYDLDAPRGTYYDFLV